MNLLRSHLPPLSDATADGMLRARAMMRDKVSSAALRVLPPGVFITRIPLQGNNNIYKEVQSERLI